ncbi:hypothetical protein KFK09_016979 [Dendrobium nobile]|uniref:Uncharacterized protein n=1 Tax=Dendrobium nobile TaxID=94219 RepID=A0A8T3B195_DENNO|nr:hypothetical protein KFK09_016979 [Dendrobium nobile]
MRGICITAHSLSSSRPQTISYLRLFFYKSPLFPEIPLFFFLSLSAGCSTSRQYDQRGEKK